MTMTTAAASGGPILTPEEVGALVVDPMLTVSVAAQVSTVVHTNSHEYRVPVIVSDPTAAWVREGEEINPSDVAMAEVVAEMRKLAGLTIISNELRDDSTPAAAAAVGDGLARDLARKLDAAFFGALADPAPAGLGALSGISTVAGGSAITSTDAFVDAAMIAESNGTTITDYVANPADLATLAKVKKASGSNEPLLAVDPTQAARRIVAGVPILASPAVPAGTIYGIARDRALLVIREDATVEVDGSVFFTSDRSAVRAKLRAAFAFPSPASLVRITIGGK